MRFACTQENLIQGLQMVGHLSGKNANLPVLGNVLLKTESGLLKLSATNLEMAVHCTVRGKVEADGEYSVPAKLFLDFVSLLPTGKIELALTDEGLEVRAGDQETVLKGMPASEFPLLPRLSKEAGIQMNAMDLKRALGQVVFAVSPSQSRPELGGVACFAGEAVPAGKMAMVATDSYRLAERMVSYTGASTPIKTIVPARAFAEVSRILGAYKDELQTQESATLRFTENQFVFTYGEVELISRLIEGSFPDYKPFIPESFKTEAVVSRSELQKAVRAASLFSRQGIFDVHLTLDPDAGTCLVQSADQGTGKTKTSIKGTITGQKNLVTLNFRYFGDGLSAMASDAVRLKQIDSMNPLLVVPEGSTEEYRYIVMPIRQ